MPISKHRDFGEILRSLRKQRREPLRVVAASVGIDSTLLSKLERGDRFPTHGQIVKLAEYFNVPVKRLTAQVIAERIVSEYGSDATTLEAITIVRERISAYAMDSE